MDFLSREGVRLRHFFFTFYFPFVWVACWDKISMMDHLISRRWTFCNRCMTYKTNAEFVNQLLLRCLFAFEVSGGCFVCFLIFWFFLVCWKKSWCFVCWSKMISRGYLVVFVVVFLNPFITITMSINQTDNKSRIYKLRY